MHERNSISNDSGLFANKGQAEPTRDFVPRLKTDEPAQIEPAVELAESQPEAKPPPGADGLLGGLIRRRTDSQQTLSQPEQAKLEAARRADAEAEEIARSVSEHIDNGMLYESLKLGLPLPKLGKAKTNSASAGDETKSFGEAALERLARPTTREPNGTVTTAHADTEASAQRRARKGHQNPHRRQLTARLSISDFDRFKHYADVSGRTYQDILSTAATHYLDEVTGDSIAADTFAAMASKITENTAPAVTQSPASPPAEATAVKSPFDWFDNG